MKYLLLMLAMGAAVLKAGAQEWPERPFVHPWSEPFAWGESDSLAMDEWLEIRERWFENPPAAHPSTHVEISESVWGWWLRSGGVGPVAWCLGLGLIAGGLLRRSNLRRLKRQQSDSALTKWPALSMLATASEGGFSTAARTAAAESIRSLLSPARKELSPPVWPHLNDSEAECAHLTLQRLSTREIADIMHCTTRHIYNLRTSIRKKLDIPTSADLVAELMRRASSPNVLSSRDGKVG